MKARNADCDGFHESRKFGSIASTVPMKITSLIFASRQAESVVWQRQADQAAEVNAKATMAARHMHLSYRAIDYHDRHGVRAGIELQPELCERVRHRRACVLPDGGE